MSNGTDDLASEYLPIILIPGVRPFAFALFLQGLFDWITSFGIAALKAADVAPLCNDQTALYLSINLTLFEIKLENLLCICFRIL